MTGPAAQRKQRKSLAQYWQRWVQTRVWRMDIHPSAWVAPSALIDRTWPRGIHIAAGCIIDEEAVILTHDLTRGVYLDTHIGARSIVGPRAMVLPGVRVGEDCVLFPGALVNRNVPNGSVVVGNPGQISPRGHVPDAAEPVSAPEGQSA